MHMCHVFVCVEFLVDFDGGKDFANKPETSDCSNGSGDEEKCTGDEEHVTKVK